MTIKLIAMDMDGTLLNQHETITKETFDALIQAQKQGIRLVLASGRTYAKLMKYALELKMDEFEGYLIEVNGMALYDMKKQEREVFKRMSRKDVEDIFAYLQDKHIESQFIIDRGMYVHIPDRVMEVKKAYRIANHIADDFPWTGGTFLEMVDNREFYPDLKYVKEASEIGELINKVCILDPNLDYVKEVHEVMKDHFKDRFWLGRTAPRWLEVMPSGVTKGNAITRLCERLGITKDEVMCFGDGENDIEMMQSVSFGIAMGNAMDNVKKVAYDITDTNNEDGIAKALHRFEVIK